MIASISQAWSCPAKRAMEDEIGIRRVQPRERVHLQEHRPPLRIAAQIDAAAVAAAEQPPRGERDRAGRARLRVIGKTVADHLA